MLDVLLNREVEVHPVDCPLNGKLDMVGEGEDDVRAQAGAEFALRVLDDVVRRLDDLKGDVLDKS